MNKQETTSTGHFVFGQQTLNKPADGPEKRLMVHGINYRKLKKEKLDIAVPNLSNL